MPVTQQDIAEKIGVSRRLVSYALNGESRVGAATQNRILEVAQEMGYQTNRAARALVTGRTHQIALCFPYFLGSSFYNAIIREFEILARATPYDLLMVTIDLGSEKGGNLQFTADGTIFVGSAATLPKSLAPPAVAIQNQLRIEPSKRAQEIDRVEFELEGAAQAVMRHLLEQGRRRIAYVAPTVMLGDFEWRCHAYQSAMQNAGLPSEIIELPIANEELIRQQSHRTLKEYFSANGFPDALFCCNDDIAMGAYRALGELQREIPNQTAVVGFDDLDYSSYLNPPLTSVLMPIGAACRMAWEMLMQRLENPSLPPQFQAIEAHLVVRESSLSKSKNA